MESFTPFRISARGSDAAPARQLGIGDEAGIPRFAKNEGRWGTRLLASENIEYKELIAKAA
jgi:hypothetical protein